MVVFVGFQMARAIKNGTVTRFAFKNGSFRVTTRPVFPDLYEASVLELQEGLDAGHFSSVNLVKVKSQFYKEFFQL